ncbi:MAG TPA: carboxypeptidase-like regulatory domain-containing protein [Bacteroidia bacterium]
MKNHSARIQNLRSGIIIFLFSALVFKSYSQDRDLIQFSGVIVEADSLRPVPYTRVILKTSGRGTISDFYGYFSFVAKRKDTVIFSAIGYKKAHFIIPDTLTSSKYSLIQVLRYDTIYLNPAVIFPWPTKEQFKEVFLNMKVPDDDLARAKKNLAQDEMKSQYESMPMDAGMNFKGTMQQYQSRLYWTGQYPPNNLLNPFAWAQFIKMWREGKLKMKKANDEEEK